MESNNRGQVTQWRWPLLVSVIFLNVSIPSLVHSYGIFLLSSVSLGLPVWLSLATPTIFIVTHGLTQCWCRDAADSWGGPKGYRLMAGFGLGIVVASLLACAFTPYHFHPLVYGVLGGMGSSIISAQVDAVVFDTYDSDLGIIRGLCFTGQAVGMAIFPHIITFLISYYGHPFSYIVLAGIILQTLPVIMFLRVADNISRPVSFSRYGDLSKTYALFGQGDGPYAAELQLHDLSKKSWKNPLDDCLHQENEEEFLDEVYDNEGNAIITPPPSPEEKRKNIFGVEILPEIPEESECTDSDTNTDNDESQTNPELSNNKKRLSQAIKRLSTMGDNFSDYITKQVRRDSQASHISSNSFNSNQSENKEYCEVEVTYENLSPVTDKQREKILNSFSYRCESAYASMKRRLWIPSYRMYKLKRRTTYCIYNLNDTLIKPLTRSLSCWRFYPSILLCLAKLILTSISVVLLPIIASQIRPRISLIDANFLMTLYAFTWACFLLCTPWLALTPKRNYKYVTVLGLAISTGACFMLAEANNHDMFSFGCVVAGFGYGAITSCWETAVQEFVGARKWPKLHSTLETLSVSLLAGITLGLSFVIKQASDLQFCMFLVGILLSIVTFIWSILAIVSIYVNQFSYFTCCRNWRL